MATITSTELSRSLKAELFAAATDDKKYRALIATLDARLLKQLQEFVWAFIVDESQAAPTKRSRSEIMAMLEPTARYQQRAKCLEPLGYCTIAMCVRINPSCAATRIGGILTTLRPLLTTLLEERPELTDLPQVAEPDDVIPTAIPQPALPVAAPKKKEIAAEGVPQQRERKEEIVPEELKARYAKFRPMLWSMVETEGLEYALLITEGGGVLQHASSHEHDVSEISQTLADEVSSVIEQGEAVNYTQLLTVTKEFEGGVVAMRSIGGGLYLIGISSTVLPGKIHSLIIKLGGQLIEEIAKQ
ncbi:MAG: hypothetical protein IAF08_07085 [Rhizobacter sp.]|nr:hypothetical protein [Chlorobiales bacterium]